MKTNESSEEVRELTRQLKLVNQDLEEIQYAVFHDLKAPLRAVSGFSEILKEEFSASLNPEANRLIDTVIDNSNAASQLINNLVDFSNNRKRRPRYKMVDMQLLVKQCINNLLAGDHQGKYNVIINDLPCCQGDEGMLREVWHELLKNAFLYSSQIAEPAITISCHQSENENTYQVADNGIGFDMEYSEKIFHLFHRLHNNTQYAGAGKGLAMVKQIVLQHGGKAWAVGEPGKGATFFFNIPASNTLYTNN